jgi:hypothetical protein
MDSFRLQRYFSFQVKVTEQQFITLGISSLPPLSSHIAISTAVLKSCNPRPFVCIVYALEVLLGLLSLFFGSRSFN